MKIQTKIAALGIVFTVATAAVIVSILQIGQSRMSRDIQVLEGDIRTTNETVAKKLREGTTSELNNVNQVALDLIATTDINTDSRVKYNFGVAKKHFAELGPMHLGSETVQWRCVNQVTNETVTLALPKMLAGTTEFVQNSDARVASPVVDTLRSNTLDYCTIFQRMNAEGDMVRICTSVINPDGTRAIGTYIPRRNLNGTENPILESILKGETYYGQSMIVGKWHRAEYEPIWDQEHKQIIGMLFVGADVAEKDTQIRESLMKIRVAKSGNIFAIGTKGQERGVYVLSKAGKRNGENVWEAKDADGRLFIQEMTQKAVDANGAPVHVSYPWSEPGDSQKRMKIATVSFYKDRGWLVGATCYEEDILEAQKTLETATGKMIQSVGNTATQIKKAVWQVIITAFGMAIVSVVVGYKLARSICRPLAQAVKALESSDLRTRLPESGDEVGMMAAAFNRMLGKLSTAMRQISLNAGALATSSEGLSTVSRRLGANAEETSAQANLVSAACEQVSSNVQTVAAGAEEMNASFTEIARNSIQAVQVAGGAVKLTDEANETITLLGQSSREIGEVIKVITSIAQQTNLLALNATIEAARAGEAGKGFAVVASEVKELAKGTASATENISDKIGTIQLATQNAVDAIGKISEIMGSINDIQNSNASAVEEQGATTNEMSRNLAEASTGSQEIAQNIAGVAQSALDTTIAANETLQAAQHLSRLSAELNQLIGEFDFEEDNETTLRRDRYPEVGVGVGKNRDLSLTTAFSRN